MLRCGRYITPPPPPCPTNTPESQTVFFIFFQPLFTFLYGAMPVSLWPNWSHHSLIAYAKSKSRGVGVLPYITYTGMCRPKGSWFWSSWFRTGYPFQRPFLERGIIFRTHESSTFVSSHLKLFKDRLLLKIRFNALTSKPLYSCVTP